MVGPIYTVRGPGRGRKRRVARVIESAKGMDDDDARLLEGIRRGDGESARILYERTRGFLLDAVIRPRVGSADAEDVLSETWLRAVERLRAFEWRGIGLLHWLSAIARRTALERLRRVHREEVVPDLAELFGDVPDGAPSAEADMIAAERLRRMRERVAATLAAAPAAPRRRPEPSPARRTGTGRLRRGARRLDRRLRRPPAPGRPRVRPPLEPAVNRDELETGPVTAAEAQAARHLADALDGGDGAGADAEALAVTRLLASLGEHPRDELAARRGAARAASALRTEARKRLAVRLLAPLAAALVLAAGLSGRRGVPPAASEVTLAEREAEARAALARLAADPSGFRSDRAESLLAKLSESRFDSYRRERASALGESDASKPVPSETPSGGRT